MSNDTNTERLQALLKRLGLPTSVPPDLAPDALFAHMRLDKKNRAGALRLILWRGIGRAEIADNVDADAVRDAMAG